MSLAEIRDLRVEAETDSGRRADIIKGVSLTVAPGEIVALIGESGSGKTTIALSLLGHTRPGCRISGGAVVLDGHDLVPMTEAERGELRGTEVAYVPQSAAAAFNPARSIMDQVIEVAAIHHLMPAQDARERAVTLFRALALPHPETIGARYPHQVSGGQLQRLAAAMALIGAPKLVIFDEPTTALDVTTQIEVLRAFKSVMRAGGMGGIYVSHDLAVVAQIADRIVVLNGGEVQEEGRTEDILHRPLHPYTRSLLAAFEPKHRPPTNEAGAASRPMLEVVNAVAGYGPVLRNGKPAVVALDTVSCVLHKGQNLGVIGESGSGKSTLARAIAGLLPPVSGAILLGGKEIEPDARRRTKEQLRRLQIVFQLADTALNPARSVGDILGRPLTFYHGEKGAARDRSVDELLDMVRLPRALRHRLPGELSGGQKQRVNLARALAARPEVILCDEVTSALDTVVAAAILDLLRDLQRDLDLSYVFISHDLSTVQAICDEVLVMYHGEVVERLAASDLPHKAMHPYSQTLFASVPTLDPGWLDSLPGPGSLKPETAR